MFVLVEFKDKSLSVMDISSIDEYEKFPPKLGDEVVVTWPASGKKRAEKCQAVVLQFGEKEALKRIEKELVDGKTLQNILQGSEGRGCRQKRKKLIETESESEDDKYKKVHTKAKKVAGDVGHSGNLQAILNRVKDRRSELGPAESNSDGSVEIGILDKVETADDELVLENRKLKVENKNLKAAIATLNILPSILSTIRKVQSAASDASSNLSTSHTSRSEAETETYPSPGTGTNLSDDTEDDSVIEKKLSSALQRASRLNVLKMTNDLMHGMFSGSYMATHSLTGTGNKAALPAKAVDLIIVSVKREFGHATGGEIRCAIRQKLCNAAKILKAQQARQSSLVGQEPIDQ